MPDDVDEYDLDAELACLEDGEGVGLDEFDSMGVGNANSNKKLPIISIQITMLHNPVGENIEFANEYGADARKMQAIH